jgi:hypothetical protein
MPKPAHGSRCPVRNGLAPLHRLRGLSTRPVASSGGGGGSVSNQTATFGALTVAGRGGFKPVDSNGDTVALTTYNSLVSGSLGVYTPSISSGALVFSGAAGAPNAAVLRCSHAGGTVDITISSLANYYSELPVMANIDSALSAIGATGGKHILVRRGSVGNTTAWNPAKFVNFASMVYIEGEGLAASGKGTKFNSIYAPWVTGLGFRNVEVDASGGTDAGIGNSGDSIGRFDVEDCYIHGKVFDPTVVYTAATAPGRSAAGVSLVGRDCVVQRNLIEYCNYGVQTIVVDTITCRDNEVRFFFDDSSQFSYHGTSNTSGAKIYERNVCYSPIEVDGGHPDGLQIASGDTRTFTGWVIRQNVWFDTPGVSSGTMQGNFMSGGWINSGAIVCGNIFALSHLHALTDYDIVGGVFNNNTLVRFDTSGSGPDIPQINLGLTTSSGTVLVKRNLADAFVLNGSATYTQANNLTLGNRGATNAYTTVFNWANAAVAATTFAQIKTNLTRNTSGPASADAGALYSTWFTMGDPRTPGGWSYNSACEA